MSNVVLILSKNQIDAMKSHYSSKLGDKVPPGSIFTAKPEGCTVTAYKSGKVLFQGGRAEEEARRWDVPNGSPAVKSRTKPVSSSVTKHAYSPPETIGSLSILGSDEVGTGDYFGPITVVAVYVNKEQIPLLKELGVKDSKNLKDPQIIEIARQIKDIVPFSLLVCDNRKYNQLQSSGMSQGKMKALLHNQAIIKCLEKIEPEKPDGILIDQFAQPEVFFNYLKGKEVFKSDAVYLSTKAEGIHVAVAAASIIARYAFVKHFDLLSEKAGFTIPKGAGPAVDKAAARLIKEKGIESLNEFTKLHFANTEKAKKLLRI